MKNIILKLASVLFFSTLWSIQMQAQCLPASSLTLGNGNDGEGISFNPNDGLLYHISGIDDGDEFFESIDPATLTVGPNLVPGDTYGPAPAQELTGIAWYPPLGAFIAMDRDQNIYAVTAGGAFTLLSTFVGSGGFGYMRGFAVVGTSIYGVDPGTGELVEFNPTTGGIVSSIIPTDGGVPINAFGGGNATGLTTHPITGEVYIVFRDPVDGLRHLGIVDPGTGVITDLGDMGNNFSGITFDSAGVLYAISGDGATPPETLFFDFDPNCVPLAALIPTMSEWGIIMLMLMLMSFGMIFVTRREPVLAVQGQNGGTAGFRFLLQKPPFVKSLFLKALVATACLAALAGILSFIVYGTVALVDVIGTLIAGPIFAYLMHLLAMSERGLLGEE